MKDTVQNTNEIKSYFFLALLALVIVVLVATNELDIGACTFLPLTLLAYWLMTKAFGEEKPSK